eukprot:TRINITY_DN5428_c0_g1_i1.p1 TRINITY_DN5428_c0_g1~~TRINITY_DN5428_c0_g1_i1.p1  ORF type:complete len:247 (+),score=38.34 TRINITY_DN5428_c0_g1_i1:397-1137(+)
MADNDFRISTLSTQNKTAPLYASHGWQNVTRYLYKQRVDWSAKGTEGDVQKMDFTNEARLEEVSKIYTQHSKKYQGPHHRDLNYWRTWIMEEASLPGNQPLVFLNKNGEVSGYACFGLEIDEEKKKSLVTLKDFAVNENEHQKDSGKGILRTLLLNFLGQVESRVAIVWPAPLFDNLFEGKSPKAKSREYYMYYPVGHSSSESEISKESIVELLHGVSHQSNTGSASQSNGDIKTSKHLFWPLDGF